MPNSMLDRLLNKVTFTKDCWLWTGCKSGRYGGIRIDGRLMLAHRVAYTVFFGDIPYGLEVCHSCDNGYCINPNHLFLATHKENMMDAGNKGRWTRQYCPKGHLMDDANTYFRDNGRHRVCLTCKNQQNKNRPSREAYRALGVRR